MSSTGKLFVTPWASACVPLSWGATWVDSRTICWNVSSFASWTSYQKGRSLFDVALPNFKTTGVPDTTRTPLIGSTSAGIVMLTPAISPAMFGLSGFRLSSVPQAASPTAKATGTALKTILVA